MFDFLRRAAIYYDDSEFPSGGRPENSKRAPYGFVGMRGKRNLQPNADDSESDEIGCGMSNY